MAKELTPIEERFWRFLRLNPERSTYMCFAATIWGRNLPENFIEKNFGLIDEIEYFSSKEQREQIWKTLVFLNQDKTEIQEPHEITPYEVRYLGIRAL